MIDKLGIAVPLLHFGLLIGYTLYIIRRSEVTRGVLSLQVVCAFKKTVLCVS